MSERTQPVIGRGRAGTGVKDEYKVGVALVAIVVLLLSSAFGLWWGPRQTVPEIQSPGFWVELPESPIKQPDDGTDTLVFDSSGSDILIFSSGTSILGLDDTANTTLYLKSLLTEPNVDITQPTIVRLLCLERN